MHNCLHSTDAEKPASSLPTTTDRAEDRYAQNRNDELVQMATKEPNKFRKVHLEHVFRKPPRNPCPVELRAQFEAFRALMGRPLPRQRFKQQAQVYLILTLLLLIQNASVLTSLLTICARC